MGQGVVYISQNPSIGQRQMELQKEQYEESKRALDLFYGSLDSMNSGGQNLRNVIVIHANSGSRIISVGESPDELRFEEPVSGASHTVRSASRISSDISERSGETPSSSARQYSQACLWLCCKCGEVLERRRHSKQTLID